MRTFVVTLDGKVLETIRTSDLFEAAFYFGWDMAKFPARQAKLWEIS